MYEDCNKHLKNAKIGFIVLGSMVLLGLLTKLGVLATFNSFVMIYTVFAMIYGYIKIEPYIACLSKYKDKKF
jgi:hypothetical protein